MELLLLLGIGLTVGGVALALDDDDDDDSSGEEMDAAAEEAGTTADATEGNDDLAGASGDDTVFAGDGNDILDGNGGDDRLFGQDGEDALIGGAGDDFLRGGSGADLIVDGQGSDTIHGDLGSDLIVATSAIDSAQAVQAVRDWTALEDPDDSIRLAPDWSSDTDEDPDEIYAGYGNDTVIAGDGDTVTLGEGRDELAVGGWMTAGDDPVTVTDFDASEDRLVYVHDGESPLPEFSVTRLGDGSGDGQGSALVFADNVLIARLPGAGGSFTLGDLAIVDRGGNSHLFF